MKLETWIKPNIPVKDISSKSVLCYAYFGLAQRRFIECQETLDVP
jgi:hypothetical protein